MAKFSAGLGCIEIFLNDDIWSQDSGWTSHWTEE